MKRSGSLLLALLLLASAAVRAELSASIDRTDIRLGDSVRLEIVSSGDEDPANVSLRQLERDFEIIQRSSSSSTSIINGKTSRTRTLSLELLPRREGSLTIPPLRAGAETTAPITVEVGPPPSLSAGDEIVVFEAELDRDSVYVQGQLLLTLRIMQAVNLDARSVTELQLDDAFVKQLGQNSFQRTIDGKPWLVHEIRYAIFPEQSGTLTLPEQVFQARISQGRRSIFDRTPSGPSIRRTTEPVTVEVLPRPGSFPGQEWLPAIDLTLEEKWSSPPESLRSGDSITRTVTLRATGLQGAQLPPIAMPDIDGLKLYPDKAVINDDEGTEGIIGERIDSAALVPVKPGRYTLPEVRVPWWDTDENRLRYATLPAREIEVLPASGATTDTAAASPVTETASDLPSPVATASGSSGFWPWITAVCAIGWLGSTLWALRLRAGRQRGSSAGATTHAVSGSASKVLRSALQQGDPVAVRQALVAWAAERSGRRGGTLQAFAERHPEAGMAEAVAELEAALYRGDGSDWNPAGLRAAIDRIEAERTPDGQDSHLAALYPGTASV